MKNKLICGSIGTALSAVGTGLQPNEVLEIISLCITIIGGIITFIIMPLLNWYNKAKQDGKIDADELEQGAKIVIDGSEKIKSQVEDKQDEKKGEK